MNTALLPVVTIEEAMECATLMASIDPWVTLKRPYDDCLKLFLDRSRDIFIIKDNNEVIAFCVIDINSFPKPYISVLGVHPTYQGKGIGTFILKWAENEYGKINGKIFIAVSSFNSLAKKVYERFGFVQIGELKNYIIDGHSELLMQKVADVRGAGESSGDHVYATGERSKMDIDFIYFNLKNLYWATNLTRENLIGRIMNSMCFGVFANGRQAGFARVVTDYFSFAYLADVFVDEKERGKGYARILMEYIIDYPSLRDIKWLLATRDMHALYEKFGFSGVNNPDRFMGKNGWRSF